MNRTKIQQFAHKLLDSNHVETDYIEYKKSEIFKDKILKTICAYANNYMDREIGLIFIGVEEVDNKETGEKAVPMRPIIGIEVSKLESIENSLKSLLSEVRPSIKGKAHIITDEIDGKYYIVLAVEPGGNGPYTTSEKAEASKSIHLKAGRYIRIERDTILPNPAQEFELLKKFSNYSFSSDYNELAELKDINFNIVREYLRETGSNDDILKLTDKELAKSMQLTGKSDFAGERVKNFAVLMFTDRPADYIPGAYTSVIWESDKGTDLMGQKIFDGPIWKQSEEALNYIKTNFIQSYTIRGDNGGKHKEIYNWPFTALVEIVRNAILHKEYAENQYVGIYIYKERITVINHNRPMLPVTIRDLNVKTSFDDRKYINPELKDMFRNLSLIETFGSGIRRAKNAMERNESPSIYFEPGNETDNYTMAVLPINREVLKDTLDINKSNDLKLSSGDEKVLNLLKINDKLSIKDIADLTGLSVAGVNYCIKSLKNKNLIRREGGNRNGNWIIL